MDEPQPLHSVRKDYSSGSLIETNLPQNPLELFKNWLDLAMSSGAPDANAMTLSTVNEAGKPSSRIVLLKSFDDNGFVFFTNYLSRKGKNLEQNHSAALNFFWPSLERQVRIEGSVQKVSEDESTEYFHSRPRESQIGAHASRQSSPLTSRSELEEQFELLKANYEGKEIPRPQHWGGYCLSPETIEFWQGRVSRLHDRIQYERNNNSWIYKRLYP